MAPRRNRRGGVEDLWRKADGTPAARDGRGKRWRARWVDDTGRERARAFARKVDAQRWIDTQTSALVTGTYADPNDRTTIAAVADAFLASQGHLKESTLYEYKSLERALIRPTWGARRVNEVRRTAVEAWLASLVDAGKSGSRVRQAGRLLSQIMEHARTDRLIAVNPCEGVKLPRERKARPDHYLTAAQVWALSGAAGDRWGLVVRALAFTGLRWGELAALTAGDVDLERSRLTVSKAYSDIGGRMVLGSTKNHETRWVPLPSGLFAELRPLVASRAADELLFQRDGGPVRASYFLRTVIRPAAKGCAGIPDEFVTHDLRHTAASLAIRGGVHVKTLQRMLGHKTATLTLDRYGHLFPDDLDAAGMVMDSAAYPLRTCGNEETRQPGHIAA